MAECAIEESTKFNDENLAISIAEVNEIKKQVDEGGIARLKTFVKGKLEEWKNTPVSIAIIGRSGAGKSTFINEFLDLRIGEAAEIGATETTSGIQSYQNPKYPNITLWDLPGVGTKSFPKDTYLQDIKVEKYDIFILMTSIRFTENDECKWLASELNKIGRVIFFVRTKVWNDVRNCLRGNIWDTRKRDEIILRIRKECVKNLGVYLIPLNNKLYLIDSHEPMMLDFNRLRHDMVKNLPENKKEALLHICFSIPPDMIKMKEDAMRRRILYGACISGATGLVPIPGTSFAFDTMLLTQLRNGFAEDLGLNKDFLSNLKEGTISSSVHDMVKAVISDCLEECMEEGLKRVTMSETIEQVSAFIPFIGPVISVSVSFSGTYLAANKMLDRMIADALKIYKMIANDVANKMNATPAE